MQQDLTVEQKLKKARSKLILNHPFFGTVVMKKPMIEAPHIPTYATDGERLYYNPALVEQETVEEIMSELAHEVMHDVLLHPWRLHGRNPKKFNWAGDLYINTILQEADFKMFESEDWVLDHDREYQYEDDDGNNKLMNVDKIYTMLPDMPPSPSGGGAGDGPQHIIMNPGLTGDNQKDGGSGKSAEQSMQENLVLISQAAMVAKSCGKLSGSLEALVEEIVNPRIPWQDVLLRFVEQNSVDDYSWEVPDRRFLNDGIYIPDLFSRRIETMVFTLDTSGSMSKEECEECCSELSGILESVDLGTLYFIQGDADVKGDIAEYTKEDLPLKITRRGFGGTDFRPPFQWVADNDIQPACFIYATDMMCNSFPDEPDYPVLWLASSDARYDEETWPFGEVVDLKTS